MMEGLSQQHSVKADFRELLRQVPHRPGVYLMRDRFHSVIYVGKASDLRRRLSHYFQASRKTLENLKTRALINSIWSFDWHVVRNESEALLLEAKLIKEIRPRYNVNFRDDKRFYMVRVHMDDALPRFRLTRLRKEDGARYFGPFAHSRELRETIDWLNRHFGLRVCRPLLPGAEDYRHCHADIIRNCSAPCIGRISPEAYRQRVEEACAVLDGRNREVLVDLRGEMEEAAAELDFEKAAKLRDVATSLTKTMAPSRRFVRGRGVPRGPEEAGNALADVSELRDALGLETLPLLMECFDISNISDTYSVASMVRFRNGLPDNRHYRRYRIRGVEGQNDFASIAEVVRRRYGRILGDMNKRHPQAAESQEDALNLARRLVAEEQQGGAPGLVVPDLVIVDGGKGQLAMAMRELQRLGLHGLPVIGLAKQREEIWRPEASGPVILPADSGALKLLQRIRDEAHRFANAYHQLLLKKRMRESLLDDIPGMSTVKKQRLLEAFGSVARLRRQPVEKIASVKGISANFARKLLEALRG